MMDNRKKQVGFYLILLICAVVPLFSLGLSNHGLWTADEPRVAEIGREMALSGNWAVPTLNQKPFLEEPPLHYAAIATVFRISGIVSDRIVRIPSALFAFGGVLALFFLGTMLMGPRVGFISGFVMATCGEYFRVAHWVIVDNALTCFVLLALTFFMAAYLSRRSGRRLLFYTLCYVSCALAFYAKGFIGVVIPGLAVLAFLIFQRDIREIVRMRLWLGVGVFLVMVAPWFLELWRQGGSEYLRVFLVHNHLDRFAGGSSGHHQPFYYYLTGFFTGFLPWSLLIVPVFYRVFQKTGESEGTERTGLLFGKCWFIAGFLFLSAASTKRVLYLMPIFAPISLMTGWYVNSTLKGIAFKKFERVFVWLFGLTPLIAGAVAIPAYLYFCRRYDFASSRAVSTWIIAFSLISVVLSVEALCRHRGNRGHFWSFSGASVFSLLILVLVAVIPLIDRYKSFVPFCTDIADAVPASTTLYAYKPDETLMGAVPFYTGRQLQEVESVESLQEVGNGEVPAFVVARDKRRLLETEVLGTGHYSVISKRGMDTERSLLLFKSGLIGASGSGR
jgi:4-amino-4-deoxy-L-arabinose transferase-like glycosyltransferase